MKRIHVASVAVGVEGGIGIVGEVAEIEDIVDGRPTCGKGPVPEPGAPDVEALVKSVTDAVMAALNGR